MSSASKIANVAIRDIWKLSEMRAVEELQKEVWGIPDLDVVPLTQLVAAKEAGGVLIGAFAGRRLIGFVYGFPSFERGRAAHHSHMLAVKPAYRNLDLGRRLKLAQRDYVLEQGIELISWTFDPLQSLNAHFNFGKLGVVCDRYLPDFYGADAASFLHQTGTDRLWVSWLIAREPPVSDSVNAGPPLVQLQTDQSPQRNNLDPQSDHATIEIPVNIDGLLQQNRDLALRWRRATRSAFIEALNAGYYVESFTRDTRAGRYLLTKGTI